VRTKITAKDSTSLLNLHLFIGSSIKKVNYRLFGESLL